MSSIANRQAFALAWLGPERAREFIERGFANGFRPEPRLTVTEWADAKRFLTTNTSAEPGKYSSSRTPYVVEIQDCLSATSPIVEIIVQASAQVAKTTMLLNWIGYIIEHAPGPAMLVQPTVELARRFSMQRVDELIENTPAIAGKVREAKSRDSGNTTLRKEFPGGELVITGANSGVGLRSMSARYLGFDEVDGYPMDINDEGDPVFLAERRGATYGRRRKVFKCSTPTVEDASLIEREMQKTDKRRFYVPCPECGDMAPIWWKNIRWQEGKPETAALKCVACEALIPEGMKTQMLARGEWRATAVATEPNVRGYYLNALYSPLGWVSWSDCARLWIQSQNDPVKLKAFVNTILGETWADQSGKVEADDLAKRVEKYAADVPHGVGILTAAVDVQDDRLELVVKGWGAMEESWLIDWQQIHGDPARPAVWAELDKHLATKRKHESGQLVGISCVTIDSGGHHTDQVYKYCKGRAGRRVYAIRGGNETGKPIVGRPTNRNAYRAKLFTLCTDTAKSQIMARLKIESAGPGFLHLRDTVADDEYLEQLTAEKAEWRYPQRRGRRHGRPKREWIKIRERNEALDLEVYAMAALYILGQIVIRSLPERAAALSVPVEKSDGGGGGSPPPAAANPSRPRRRSGWVDGWKK